MTLYELNKICFNTRVHIKYLANNIYKTFTEAVILDMVMKAEHRARDNRVLRDQHCVCTTHKYASIILWVSYRVIRGC